MMKDRVYADYNATTPVDPVVVETMLPYWSDKFGNPSSPHIFGWETKEAVSEARKQVARLIGARSHEIYFTSGATESNNIIINWAKKNKQTIFTSKLEHKSIIEPCEYLSGADIVYLKNNESGTVDHSRLLNIGERDFVTLCAGNNEIHTVTSLNEVGNITREIGCVFHTDASQYAGDYLLMSIRWELTYFLFLGIKFMLLRE